MKGITLDLVLVHPTSTLARTRMSTRTRRVSEGKNAWRSGMGGAARGAVLDTTRRLQDSLQLTAAVMSAGGARWPRDRELCAYGGWTPRRGLGRGPAGRAWMCGRTACEDVVEVRPAAHARLRSPGAVRVLSMCARA
jgi:hypothetical protein